MKLLPFMLALLLGMLGCKSVQPSDVAGNWLMNDSSRPLLPDKVKQAAGKINLRKDGTFTATELPEELAPVAPYNTERTRLCTGTGVWKLVVREGKQQVQLNFETMDGAPATNLPYGTQMEISFGWNIGLEYFLGDADEGRKISFRKK